MVSIIGTKDYVIFQDEVLGKGAMGVVSLCRHRHKANKFAAKIFTKEAWTQHHKYVVRETEMMRKIASHENVVQIVDVQSERVNNTEILIMELCSGGSLQAMLDEPENAYGLREDYFMTATRCIISGLAHLYRHGIVHRDIKPGNVLVAPAPGGHVTCKLSDFGTSCLYPDHAEEGGENDDENRLTSLCGTEEYLNPILHRRAFTSARGGVVKYGRAVDMWGLGVTLYQLATGLLPFRPFGGIREQKTVMQRLIGEKQRNVISRVERQDGAIEDHTALPDNTRLSSHTRKIVTELLIDLLDGKSPPQPEDFYVQITAFFAKTTVHVFASNLVERLTLFVENGAGLLRVTEAVAEAVGVNCDRLKLLACDSELSGDFQVQRCIDNSETFYSVVVERSDDNSESEEMTDIWLPLATNPPPRTCCQKERNTFARCRQMYVDILYARECILRMCEQQDSMKKCFSLSSYRLGRALDYGLCKYASVRRYQTLVVKLWNSKRTRDEDDAVPRECDLASDLDGNEERLVVVESELENIASRLTLVQSFVRDKLEVNAEVSAGKCFGEEATFTMDEAKDVFATLRRNRKRIDMSHNDTEIEKFNIGHMRKWRERVVEQLAVRCRDHTIRRAAILGTTIAKACAFIGEIDNVINVSLDKLATYQETTEYKLLGGCK